MKSCFRYLLFLLPAFVFNSCSNEIEVLADYEENAAIYALLDPYQSLQFVKINKVFTNPSSKASDVAKIADSLYFDSIAPMLVELDNGSVRRSIPLYKANILLKDSGLFANSPNYLYVTNEQIFPQFNYRLDLRLPKSNKYVTATTNMVRGIGTFFQPVSLGQRVFSIPPTGSIQILFNTGTNGKIYDAYFNFNYLEINKADTSIRTTKTIRWKILRSFRAISDKVSESVIQRIPSLSFYSLLINEIPVDLTVTRRFLPCSVEFIGGNLELDNYIEASTPSIGIVQKQTDYTNIVNGIGLFGARSTLFIDQVQLALPSKTTIINDMPYRALDFK